MSRIPSRRLVATAMTASCLTLVAAPAADAKSLSRGERAQNAAIKKAAKKAAAANKTAVTAGKTARSAATNALKGIADAKIATTNATSAQGGVDVILSQIPTVLDALNKLSTGLQSAGAGLTKVGAAVAAQEYGVVKVQLDTTDVPGAILVSSDIPDDSNAAVVSGSMLVSVPAGATSVPVRVLAGARSGEADGTGATDPVASAGVVSMSISSPVGVVLGGGNTGLPATVPITASPNADAGGAPVYAIPDKAPRVDSAPNPFSFPTDKAIDLTNAARLSNITGAGVGPFTVTNTAATALPVVVSVTVRFNDLTASATDVTA